MTRVLVVMPAYQERESIAEVIQELLAQQGPWDLLVVDDGSRDGTAEQARQVGATVVNLPFNLGIGGALRTGFLYAIRHGYDVVVQFDADGQHDAAGIGVLTAALTDADVVVGSRFTGNDLGTTSSWRRMIMRALARPVSLLCGTRITDATSGFRAVGPRALAVWSSHYPAEYLDNIESLVIARRAGLVIREVPVTMRARRGGEPSQSLPRAALYLGRALLVLLLASIRSHPEVRAVRGDES
jgi:glycosyltransferase involved in cell wall biosynthesis